MSSNDFSIPGISCDGCGKSLLVDESVRYIVDIKVFAAYDPMEITRSDLGEDHEGKLADLIEACKGMSAEELEEQVYKEMRFHLCPSCQKRYLRRPLGGDLAPPREEEPAGEPNPSD